MLKRHTCLDWLLFLPLRQNLHRPQRTMRRKTGAQHSAHHRLPLFCQLTASCPNARYFLLPNPSLRRSRPLPSLPFKAPSPTAKPLPRHNNKSMLLSASPQYTFHLSNRPTRARTKETQMRKMVLYCCLLPLLLGGGLFAFAQDDTTPQGAPKAQETPKA